MSARDPRIDAWLEDGMRRYSAGDASRALEAWYQVLEVDPQNARALQYVQYVRQLLALDGPPPSVGAAPGAQAAPSSTSSPAPVEEALEEAQVVLDAPAADGPSWGDLALSSADVEPARWDSLREEAKQKAEVERRAEEDRRREEALRVEQARAAEAQRRLAEQRRVDEERLAAEARRTEEALLQEELTNEPGAPAWADIASDYPADAPTPTLPSAAPPARSTPPVLVADEPAVDAWGDAAPTTQRKAAKGPWDEGVSATSAVDLDSAPAGPTLFDDLLARANPKRSAPRSPTPASGFTIATATPAMGNARADIQAALAAAGVSLPPHEGMPPPPQDELEALMQGARELFALGDFSGSLDLVEKVLKKNPAHEGALAYLARNEATLLKMYESKIGDLTRAPRPLVNSDEVIWHNLHHRAGFILSQVDGQLTYEDLLSVSGMTRFETIRILANLVQNGVIG